MFVLVALILAPQVCSVAPPLPFLQLFDLPDRLSGTKSPLIFLVSLRRSPHPHSGYLTFEIGGAAGVHFDVGGGVVVGLDPSGWPTWHLEATLLPLLFLPPPASRHDLWMFNFIVGRRCGRRGAARGSD